MVCNVSSNPEHVKMVKLSSNELRVLHPEVLNAAQTVMLQSTSKVVRDNLEAYEERWLDQVKLVKYAVDNIVDIDDFLAVSGNDLVSNVVCECTRGCACARVRACLHVCMHACLPACVPCVDVLLGMHGHGCFSRGL